MKINFNKDGNAPMELVPDSTYKVEIDRWEKTQATTGNDQIRFYAIITEGPHKGTSLLEHCVLLEQSKWRLANMIRCAGIDVTQLDTDLNVGSEDFNKVLNLTKGRTMYWEVFQDAYQGNRRMKVKNYLSDEKQEPVDMGIMDDTPEFLKDK